MNITAIGTILQILVTATEIAHLCTLKRCETDYMNCLVMFEKNDSFLCKEESHCKLSRLLLAGFEKT